MLATAGEEAARCRPLQVGRCAPPGSGGALEGGGAGGDQPRVAAGSARPATLTTISAAVACGASAASTDVWPATQSQLYAELGRLTDAALITVGAEGPRGRKEYAITDAGRLALEWGLRFSAMQREWAEWAGDRLAPLNDAR
jgi:hypothetical protein